MDLHKPSRLESIRRQLPWLAIGFSIAAISLVGWLLTPSTVRISAMINGKMLHVTAIAPMWRSADSVEAHVLQATGTQSPGKAVDQMAEALAHLGITKYFIELGDLVRVGESRFPGRGWQSGVVGISPTSDMPISVAVVSIENRAVSTCIASRNVFVIGGGSTDSVIGVAVIAPTAVLAYQLSSTLIGLEREEGFRILSQYPNVDAMWMLGDGKRVYSQGWKQYERN